jgi:hypothetical protein
MKVRHHHQPVRRAASTPAWSLTLPAWAIAPAARTSTARRRAHSPRGLRQIAGGEPRVKWTCARCGAIERDLRHAALHIAEHHPDSTAD